MTKRIVQLQDRKSGISPLPVTVSDAVYLTNITALENGIGRLNAGDNVNGMTLSQFFNRAYGQEGGRFSFLHISDTHKSNYGLARCKELMEGDSSLGFTLITGDLQFQEDMLATIRSTSRPYLTLLGNHDVWDDFNKDQQAARNGYVYLVCGAHVNMGSGTASYWYKDIHTAGASIRLVAFDEYEYTDVGEPSAKYRSVFSETQIRWFIDMLLHTPESYYLILACHQPASYNRDTSATVGKFVSEKNPSNYETNAALAHFIPMVLDAYLKKGTLSGSFACGDAAGTTMSLDYDFSACRPCRFLFHIAGHTHWDVCEYLPLYPNQLQLVIDCDKPDQYKFSDLPRSSGDESAYCINKVTLDFDNKKTVVERIGAHITDAGLDRDRIEFPFDGGI